MRFVVDASGPFAAGPTATQVGITIFARVGLLPNTVGTVNLGISRVGGPLVRIEATDPVGAALGGSQGTFERGRTADVDGRALFDSGGEPLAGHFAPFRGSFLPQVPPLFLGSNTTTANGILSNPINGAPSISNLVGSRIFNFGSDGSGPVGVATAVDNDPMNLIGDLAPVYRMYYLPRADLAAPRMITLSVMGNSVRYLISPPFMSASNSLNLPDQTITFQVPAPAAAAPLAFLAAATFRRRRA